MHSSKALGQPMIMHFPFMRGFRSSCASWALHTFSLIGGYLAGSGAGAGGGG